MIKSGKGIFEVLGADTSDLPFGNFRQNRATRSFLGLLPIAVFIFGLLCGIGIETANGQGLQKVPSPIQVRAVTESDAEYFAAGFNFDLDAVQKTELAVAQRSVVVILGKTITDGKRKDVKVNVRSSAKTKNRIAVESAELKIRTLEMRRQLARSKQRGALCDQLEAINEVTNGISFLLNLTKKPISTFVNFMIDKSTPKMTEQLAKNKGYGDAAVFTATEVIKTSASAATSGALDPNGIAF